MTTDRIKRTAALCVFGLLLGGCNFNKDTTADIDKRAEERWNLLITHKAEKAYDYLTPGKRATQTRESYAAAMNNRPVRWSSAKFKSKECDADRCKVLLDVSYSVVMPGTGSLGKPIEATSTQSETWVHVEGDWYFLPSD